MALLTELLKTITTLSRSHVKSLFHNKRVLMSGKPIPPSFLLSTGTHQLVIIDWNPEELLETNARPSKHGPFLPTIYEDEFLLVLNKESGIPSIPHTPEETETAVGSALAKVPSISDIGYKGLEPGIMHRLDTLTSGILVFAKKQEEFLRLRALWKTGKIKKTYRALSGSGHPLPPMPFTIDYRIAHDVRSKKRMIAITDDVPDKQIRGKPIKAVTHVLKAAQSMASGLTEFTIEIETGVMHQIRCHMAQKDFPILGDTIYGGQPSSRLWLHAWRLTLPAVSGIVLTLEAKLPASWPGY
ncbi:MAG: RluA family pseudouridine synthase [Bdellovibrionota bacterium]